jgi:hypothetical protein
MLELGMATKKQSSNKNMFAGIAIGAPLGTFLGWIILDNIGLGAASGTVLGAAIGSIIDNYSKKTR